MRLSIFHSTSRALREFFLVLVQGYERAPRVSQLPNIHFLLFSSYHESAVHTRISLPLFTVSLGIATVMSVSHAHFYSFRIIFTFQCSSPAVLDIITQDSERLLEQSFLCALLNFLHQHSPIEFFVNQKQPPFLAAAFYF